MPEHSVDNKLTMLQDRILFTLKFFDLQNIPLTILELRDFLFNDPGFLALSVNANYEISSPVSLPPTVSVSEISEVLKNELTNQIEFDQGYYCLRGHKELISQHLGSAVFRTHREQIIRRFVPFLKFVPFVRGVAVGGSHTLGQSKKDSDIDLLIILDREFFWLARFLVTGYFQLTGRRRHGKKIANRFCLNHYLAGPIEVSTERDPYNAMEYLRLRPEVFPQAIAAFVAQNLAWIKQFFPHAQIPAGNNQNQPKLQSGLEKLFINSFGRWLNGRLGQWQMKRILRGVPAVANETELSFHSRPRKFDFLAKFFGK